MGDFDGELDIVAELDKILAAPPSAAEDGPEPVDETDASQITAPKIEPEAEEQEDAPEVEAAEGEEAEAPAVELQAPDAVAKPKAQIDPDLDRKMGEATKTALEAEAVRNQYANALNVIVPQLQAAVMGEFADIKSQDDLFALAERDPARYNRFLLAGHKLSLVQKEQARVQQETTQNIIRTELDKVSKKLPDYTDPVKGPALREKLMAFAKVEGIEVENRPFIASDVLVLHRLMTAQEKVAGFEAEKAKQQTQIAEAGKKAAKAPPVQKPGVQRTTNKDDKATTDFSRFQKSGRVDDLASFLQNIL